MRATKPLVLLLLAGLPLWAVAQERAQDGCPGRSPYWCDSRRGWHFYEDPQPEPVLRQPPPSPPSALSTRAPELEEFDRMQKRLEEYRRVAIVSPTQANVRRYMEFEAKVVSHASRFADVAQRVAWASPQLDMTLRGRPVNARALDVFERDQLAARASEVSRLSRDHVLVFFFRSDCPYCHALAPVLLDFEARYGLRIVPVSVDDRPLPGFSQFRRDNGLARRLSVSQVPALFLAGPSTGRIVPVGFGVLSESQLLERIPAVATTVADDSSSLATQTVHPK